MDDFLITHATVVTVDSSDRVLRDAAIAVRDREITAIGPSELVSAEHPAREAIDAGGMVALPGLVDGHVHALTALYKGTMGGFGFDRTAGEDIALCGVATPEDMLAASRLLAVELLRSGVTLANVAGDAATFEVARQSAEALGQAGMKAFVQTMVADILGPTGLSADAQLADAERLVERYHGAFDGRIRVAPSPAGEVTTSLRTMRRLAALAERQRLVTHMHVFPRWPTGMLSWLARGRSPLGLLEMGGLLNERLVAVHALAATRRDVHVLARASASVVHCPSVWLNVGIGPRRWLPVKALHRAGVNLVLGTDSAGGWIEGADLFTEMRTAALTGSFLYGAGWLKPAEVLRMATINGARALGLGQETGSLEVGKRADITLLKFDRPPLQPSTDIPTMLVYAVSGRDVDTVLVDGRVVVREGRVLTADEGGAVAGAAQARVELYRRGGWELSADRVTPPSTSWLERYPNQRVAQWGRRLGHLRRWTRGASPPASNGALGARAGDDEASHPFTSAPRPRNRRP